MYKIKILRLQIGALKFIENIIYYVWNDAYFPLGLDLTDTVLEFCNVFELYF